MKKRFPFALLLSILFGAVLLFPNRSTAAGNSLDFRIIWVKERDKAQEILSKLRAGAPFWKLAMEYSLYPNASLGGYVEGAKPQELRHGLVQALKRLTPGEISPVVPLNGGYAIIKREGLGISKQKRKDADSMYMHALRNAAKGDFSSALKEAQKVIRLDATHQAASYLARVSRKVLAGKMDPKYGAEMFEAVLLFREGLPAKAKKRLQRLVRSGSSPPEVYITLGEVSLLMGDTGKALEFYTKALKADPMDPLVNFFMGAAYLKLGSYQKAAHHYQRVVMADTSIAAAHVGLATAMMGLGSIGKALRELQTALAIDPHMDSAYDQLGLILLSSGKVQDAVWAFEKALALSPDSPTYLSHMGFAYNRMGMSSKAVQLLEKALSLAPNDPLIHNNLALAYFDNGQMDKAIEHADKARSLGYKVHPDFLAKLQPYRKSSK